MDEGIDGNIHPHPSQVSIRDRIAECFVIKICSKMPGSEFSASQVDGICPCRHRDGECLHRPCRGQEFGNGGSHLSHFMYVFLFHGSPEAGW